MSYNKIGDVLVAEGHLSEALKSFRDGLAIIDRDAMRETALPAGSNIQSPDQITPPADPPPAPESKTSSTKVDGVSPPPAAPTGPRIVLPIAIDHDSRHRSAASTIHCLRRRTRWGTGNIGRTKQGDWILRPLRQLPMGSQGTWKGSAPAPFCRASPCLVDV